MNADHPKQKLPCIALIGLRGSGKSTVGGHLALALDRVHLDTDELIVERAGMTIAKIFSRDGEAAFRAMEREVITGLEPNLRAVLSLGGGVVLDPRNTEHLRKFSTMVWLTASEDVLAQRIDQDPSSKESRPSLTEQDTLEELRQLAGQRRRLYQQAADLSVDTAGLGPREVAEIIAAAVGS